MTKRAVLICAAILVQSGAAYAKPDLPPNVTTRPYKGNQAIDAIDYSFSSPTAVEFSEIKMCIATNLTNSEVQLRDNAGSFVGRSGTYYQSGNSSTVQGGSIFKYVDDGSKDLVASGSISRRGGLGGLVGLSIRFDLQVSLRDTDIKMKVLHIEDAQQNTGMLSNNGFQPIGVWPGSMYRKNIQALDAVAAALKCCILS